MPDQVIRRVDKQPEDQIIFDSIINASNERIKELSNFVDILKCIEGNYSIFLDGEWGIGKTFFVKQILMALFSELEWCQPKSDSVDFDRVHKRIFGNNSPNSENNTLCYPIYFNAWEFDYASDPIHPLVACLINEFEEHGDLAKQDKTISDMLSNLVDSLNIGFPGITANLGTVRKSLTKYNYLRSFNFNKELRERIRDVFKEAYKGRCHRFVLFIDELDRCRPEYAVKVLEALKFIFDQENLTVVFSVNSSALGKSISSWYGSGFDGGRYLKRFYDQLYGIKSFDIVQYLSSFGINVGYSSYIAKAAIYHGLTARDINRCINSINQLNSISENCLILLDISESVFYQGSNELYFDRFIFGGFAVGLIFLIFAIGEKDREKIITGNDFNAVLSWFENDEYFLKVISKVSGVFFDDTYDRENPSPKKESITRLEILYSLMFGDDDYYLKLENNSAIRLNIFRAKKYLKKIFS